MSNFVYDTFTDADGTLLENHTGQTGATWTKNTVFASGSTVIAAITAAVVPVCNIRPATDSVQAVYLASGNPPSADYTVTAILTVQSLRTNDLVGVVGRWSATANTGYIALYEHGTGYLLQSWSNGSGANLAVVSATAADGDVLQLVMAGTTISMVVNGVTIATATDTTVSPAGFAGISTYATAALSDSVGVQIAIFAAGVPLWATSSFVSPVTSQNCVLLTPPSDTGASPLPLVVYVHGSGGLSTDLIYGPSFRSLYPTITALFAANFGTGAGVRIVASDAYGNNWGNQEGQNAHVDAWSITQSQYNTSHTLIWSGSMGGLCTMSLMATNRIPDVAGVYCYFPVTNLAEEYSVGFASAINTAYGITGTPPDTYALLTAGFDPNLLVGSAFRGLLGRFRFTASYGDTVVPRVQNTDAFVTLIASYASEVTVYTSTGNHGDPSNFVPSDMVSYFQAWITADNALQTANAATQLAADQATVATSSGFITTGHSILGQAGSYPTTATSQAAQLATDQAAVAASEAYILTGHSILGQPGSYVPPSGGGPVMMEVFQ